MIPWEIPNPDRVAFLNGKPVLSYVECCGETHLIVMMKNGQLAFLDHPEGLRGERISNELGGEACGCLRFLHQWRRFCSGHLLQFGDICESGSLTNWLNQKPRRSHYMPEKPIPPGSYAKRTKRVGLELLGLALEMVYRTLMEHTGEPALRVESTQRLADTLLPQSVTRCIFGMRERGGVSPWRQDRFTLMGSFDFRPAAFLLARRKVGPILRLRNDYFAEIPQSMREMTWEEHRLPVGVVLEELAPFKYLVITPDPANGYCLYEQTVRLLQPAFRPELFR